MVNQGNPHPQNGWGEGHQARVRIPLKENVQLGVGDRDSQQIAFLACSKEEKRKTDGQREGIWQRQLLKIEEGVEAGQLGSEGG